MQRNLIIGTIAVLAILAAVASMFFTGKGNDYNNSLKPSHALGKALAEETAALIKRGKIVLIEWELKPGQLPRSSEQVESFKETLKKQKGISIAQVHPISATGPAMMVLGSGLSASTLLDIAQKNPDADAIVSFVGAPVISSQQLEQLQNAPPEIAGGGRDIYRKSGEVAGCQHRRSRQSRSG